VKKSFSNRVRVCLAALTLSLGLFLGSAEAARQTPSAPQSEHAMSEEDRPWPGIPWVVGIVLGVGTIFISLKNAKRNHLD